MLPRWGLLWLLGAAASCLLEGSLGSSPHVICVSYSSATEACPGLPPFIAEGYMDDQLIIRYESHTRKMHPRVDWINTLEKEDFRFFNKYTWILQHDQKDLQEDVQMLQRLYNQSGGFHIAQMMVFCELGEDGKRNGRWQYGYDGRDFLGYDMGTGIWTAADKEAQWLNWRGETYVNQRFTDYLENICTEWLQKYDHYRSEISLREGMEKQPERNRNGICRVASYCERPQQKWDSGHAGSRWMGLLVPPLREVPLLAPHNQKPQRRDNGKSGKNKAPEALVVYSAVDDRYDPPFIL
ncbi:class I histocompatibility antigen, F10 alpha chain-like [Protobothrops mucrosquamatus]|uniref:class I histocompatibility antigen, F10 alpha chain-like n=1 Tax=Protobothrops mucrosquamatus TaxID=103944 RepID=UPI000775B986|nr:class I histocompatibility antigen, F10 alpha chain-like [Protobothrops mucrosquamatus]